MRARESRRQPDGGLAGKGLHCFFFGAMLNLYTACSMPYLGKDMYQVSVRP